MEKMRLETPDLTESNIEKIGFLFPECVTETRDENGELKKAIDFAKLKQRLSKDIVEGRESYEFSWVGKKAAMVEANQPIRKTLRPCKEESKNWDTTENLYIEGDNLDVLKMLQESYLNSVKVIYIDPPYNRGTDLIYRDDFRMSIEGYKIESDEWDDDGKRLVENSKTEGRFHSDWCSMIYSRLVLARNLLSDDGVIFISIDDNEQENLKKICNEVFGEKCFVGEIIRKTKSMTADKDTGFNLQHENLLIYSKISKNTRLIGEEKDFKGYSNPDKDPNGDWCNGDPSAKSGGDGTYFAIVNPFTQKEDYPPQGRYWAFSKKTMEQYISSGKIKFKKRYKDTERGFIFKRYKKDAESIYNTVPSLECIKNKYMNQAATNEVREIFGADIFSYPKPVEFIKFLIKTTRLDKDAIVLDFFSGGATTAQAVMELNAEEGGQRKFIMVQVPEICPEKSAAYKAGYENICEIGKERIRRAGEKIKADYADEKGIETLDVGFRVLKSDSSNMKDVYYTPGEYSQDLLSYMESNIKEDRSDMDLLFSCLLEWGIPLSYEHITEKIGGKTVHIYNHGDLVACFEENISEDVVKEIARKKPLRVVFRDDGFGNSQDKINVEEIFKLLSPDTSLRVL